MLHIVNRFIVTASQKWWAVLLVFALNFAAFGLLFGLEDQFESVTGVPVYDTQNDLTSDTLLEQLPLYESDARTAYLRFAAFDFIFPFVVALFSAVIWALLLRLNTWRITRQMLLWNLPLFALLVTLWDWLENLSLLSILNAGSMPGQRLIDAALLFKQLKLISLIFNGMVTVTLLILLILNVIYRVVRRTDVPAAVDV